MHALAMMLLKGKQASHICNYLLISRALSIEDDTSQERLKAKLVVHVVFTITKNNMPLMTMEPICELGERHGVDLG